MPAVTATRQVITDRLSVMGLRVQTGKDPFFGGDRGGPDPVPC